MINALNIALMRIHTEVPAEILDLMFKSREAFESNYTIDQMLIDRVIRYRVRNNMNIFGGKIKEIFLRPEYEEKLTLDRDDGLFHAGIFSLYRIPPDHREGFDIIHVTQIRYAAQYQSPNILTQMSSYGNNISGMGHAISDSHTFASSPPRPNVECFHGNIIRLTPSQRNDLMWVVHVRLEYDQDFTNLNTSAIDTFADLCVATTKLIAYNKLIVPIDKAFVQSGMEIGAIKMIVDKWSDMDQKCKELEDNLAGAVMLDPKVFLTLAEYML